MNILIQNKIKEFKKKMLIKLILRTKHGQFRVHSLVAGHLLMFTDIACDVVATATGSVQRYLLVPQVRQTRLARSPPLAQQVVVVPGSFAGTELLGLMTSLFSLLQLV